MVFSQLLGLAINVTFGRKCDTMVQREEIPNVWQAASRSTLGIHANWPGGISVSSQEEGLIVISGSPLSQSNCLSVYKVEPA